MLFSSKNTQNHDLPLFAVDGKSIVKEDRLILVMRDQEYLSDDKTECDIDSKFFVVDNLARRLTLQTKYLHNDGTLHGCCTGTESSGWYTSLSEVRAAVRRHRELKQGVTVVTIEPLLIEHEKQDAEEKDTLQETFVKPYNTTPKRATDNWPPLSEYSEAARKAREAASEVKEATEVYDGEWDQIRFGIQSYGSPGVGKTTLGPTTIEGSAVEIPAEKDISFPTSKTESYHQSAEYHRSEDYHRDESHSE